MTKIGNGVNRSKPLNFLGAISCGLLFLLMAFQMVPALLYVKAFLFAVVLGAAASAYVAGRARLDARLGIWTVGLAIVGFFFVLEGFFFGAPGAGKQALVYVVWPMVYVAWVGALADERLLRAIHRTAVVATLFIGVYAILYLLTQINLIPETRLVTWLSLGWQDESFGAQEGYTAMQFPGLNSLPFLVPYLLAYVLIQTGQPSRVWKTLSWGACFLGLVVTIIASRRAVDLVACLSLPLTLLFRSFQPAPERRLNRRPFLVRSAFLGLGIVIVFLVLNSIYQFDLAGMWDRIVTGFIISGQSPDNDAIERYRQFLALRQGWFAHPLLGVGHGASAFGSIRSQTMPWAYELGYLALLFQTGIVGVMAYAVGVLWIFLRGASVIKAGGEFGRIMIAMLVGFCGVLIAQATNPYLDRFDGMWMFFLPFAVINYELSTRRSAAQVLLPGTTMGAG